MAKYNMSFRYNTDDARHLADAQHAHKLFTEHSFVFAPKTKFLYHVVFKLKDITVENLAPNTKEFDKEIGVLCKTIDLPGFKVSVDTKQQYNRKKNYQTRIDYDEVRAVFHDDNLGITTSMLREYYNFYYRDGQQNKLNYNTRDKYRAGVVKLRYGLDNDKTDTFFDFIRIYQISRKDWISYELINPILTGWNHDTLDYGDGSGMMENTINIAYEAVYYNNGDINTTRQAGGTVTFNGDQDEPVGFTSSETRYDVQHSPLISNGSYRDDGPQLKEPVVQTVPLVEYRQNDTAEPTANVNATRQRSAIVKNNTQTRTTRASSSRRNEPFDQPLPSSTIRQALENDPKLQNTLVSQSLYKGQVEGFDWQNADTFNDLPPSEQQAIKDQVIAQATSDDRSNPANLKSAALATTIIKGQQEAAARNGDF